MLSIPHLIVIFIVALVIFGPEKLPDLARNLGKLMAEFRRTTSDLRGTFESHMRDLEREASERRIDTPRQAANTTPPAEAPAENNPEIVAAPGIVPANAPHNNTAHDAEKDANTPVALGDVPAESEASADHAMMYGEDPEELIRQAEAQIARERAAEHENPERVSDGAIGKP